MRIGILCGGTYVGGTEIVTLTLARGLRARGHDVRVLSSAWTNGEFPALLADASIPHTAVHLGKISLTLRSPYLAWTAAALVHLPRAVLASRRWLTAFDPHVLIASNRDTVLLLSPILRGRAVLFHMHEAPPPTRVARAMYNRVASRTTAFIAVSEYVRSRVVDLGVPAARTFVVHNGVSATGAASVAPRASDAPFTVGIVGQIGDWKGHDDLLAALALLHERGHSFRCIVIGDGDPGYVARLRSTAERLGIAASVTWHGYARDPRSLYAALDVCVVPSRVEEAFGMVAVEAGLEGVPVVATRRGGLPEIVEDGVTGFLVDPERPSQLADRLAQLAADPAQRVALGRAARARVLARFTADRMVAEMEEHCRSHRSRGRLTGQESIGSHAVRFLP